MPKKKTTARHKRTQKALEEITTLNVQMNMRTDQEGLAHLATENAGLRSLIDEMSAELTELRVMDAIRVARQR